MGFRNRAGIVVSLLFIDATAPRLAYHLANMPVLRTSTLAGLIAGTVDIGAAAAINGVNPGLILRVIASGLWGRAAYQAGGWILPAGLVLQWIMSILIAGIYIVSARRTPLFRRPIEAGILYGAIVYAVMTFLVVPLSAAGIKFHFKPLSVAENLLAMMIFGLIVTHVAFFIEHRRGGRT